MYATTIVILQARASSRRLPGKVLEPILGEPMLLRQLERVRRARRVHGVVVATSVDPADDCLEALCRQAGVDCFRGDLHDVLDRFYQAAVEHAAQTIVRLTGDCPLADPELIDAAIECFRAGPCDYASNTIERTFPKGLDVEVFSFSWLLAAWRDAELEYEREHVTAYVHHGADRFARRSLRCEDDFSHLRWTVDEPADLQFARQVYGALYPRNADFGWTDVLDLLESRPELAGINADCWKSTPPPPRTVTAENLAGRTTLPGRRTKTPYRRSA
jgi:spore coat polysaccharide biosynthesis protein SpsF